MIAALPFLLLLLALLGAPLFAVIAASAMIGFTREGIDLQAIAIEFYGIAEMPILLAIPLFTFAGYLLSESNAPQRLVRLTTALLGWMPAGLAIVSLAACAFFTAFTGASGVTIIALGALLFGLALAANTAVSPFPGRVLWTVPSRLGQDDAGYIALVELLAYVGDHLSYYQDAVDRSGIDDLFQNPGRLFTVIHEIAKSRGATQDRDPYRLLRFDR